MRLPTLAGLLTTALLLGPIAHAQSVTWTVDAGESGLHARTHKDGIASGLAHDHIIGATQMSGKVTFDPADPSTFAISVTVPTASLEVDHPRLRRQYRLDGDIDADDRKTIAEHMRDEDQLHTSKYPTIAFESTRVTASGPGKYAVEGKLTLRGKTRPVSVPVEVTMKADRFEGRGMLRITHAQFGFEPYSAMLGAVKNKERIDLHLHIVARP